MTKTIHNIDCPEEWNFVDDFSSHRPALWLALKNTDDLVVELGSGFGSTPFLKLYCSENNREMVSYETNKEWAEKTGSVYTKTYFQELGKIGLLFVDAAPGEIRKELIEFYKSDADVMVVHDVEIGAEYVYNMKDIISTFKYRLFLEPKKSPHTVIISNKIDVTKWI